LWTLTRYKYYYTYKYRNVNTFNNASDAEKNLFNLIYENRNNNFCDLSDIVKVYLLFESGFFISGDYKYRSNTDFCVYNAVTSEDREKYGLSDEATLKSLLYNKYASSYFYSIDAIETLVQYLGLERPLSYSYTPNNLTSYFTIIQAKNSDGVLIQAVVGKLNSNHILVVNTGNKNSDWTEFPSREQESWDGYRKLATYMPKTPTWHLKNFY
jgi:hypothetical protein